MATRTPENFIAALDVFKAAHHDCGNDCSGFVDVPETIGRMTGLDMTKYELDLDPALRGWHLVRLDA